MDRTDVLCLPSRGQQRRYAEVLLLMLGARLLCQAHQLDGGPATLPSSPRMTFELYKCVLVCILEARRRQLWGLLVYCLFMPDWILTWFSHNFCQRMKELWTEDLKSARLLCQWAFKGRRCGLDHLQPMWTAPSGMLLGSELENTLC